MHDFLRGTRTDIALRKQWKPAAYAMAEGWNRSRERIRRYSEGSERATSLDIIEQGYPEAEACRQAARCLRCNVNTVFDTSICVACNGCVDICPENLIRLVGLSRILSDEHWLTEAATSFGVAEEICARFRPRNSMPSAAS